MGYVKSNLHFKLIFVLESPYSNLNMSSKKKILIIQPIHTAGIKLLEDNSDYEFEIVENTDNEFLKSKIKDCDGISIRTAKLTGEVIELSLIHI